MKKIWLIIVILLFLVSGCGSNTQSVSSSTSKNEQVRIKFVEAWVTKNSLNNPEARITYQNVSSKAIDGVKITILCYDNFDDTSSATGAELFNAIGQDTIEPQGIADGNKQSWNLYPYNNTTKFKALLTEVHFKDGTTWQTPDLQTKIMSK